LNAQFSERPFQRFLIVGVQRTGSSALAERLNTHPAIATGWEWTERVKPWKKIDILSRALAGNFADLNAANRAHIEDSIGPETHHLGFRRLFGASNKWIISPATSAKLMLDRFRPHMQWLQSNPDVRVIHIVRENHLEWIKSKFIARALSSFVGDEYPEHIRVTVPIAEARARVRAKVWIDRELAHIASTNPYLRLNYEQFAQHMEAAAEEATTFLGENPAYLELGNTTIRRQSTKSAEDYLDNHSELVAALRGL